MPTSTRASEIRRELGHPIIDADGHFVEIGPVMNDEVLSYLEEDAGSEVRQRFESGVVALNDTSTNLFDRADPRIRAEWRAMPSWWGWQAENVLDRATMHLPGLLYERLDDFGLDVALIYPSMSLPFLDSPDVELSAAVCRAVNRMHARVFAPYADRMIPGALVPMTDPDVAVTALEHAVGDLGFKTALIGGPSRRPIGRVHESDPSLDTIAYRLDTFGLDSEYDYDPVWEACCRLGVSPVTHRSMQSHRITRSISNYVYNHVGGLAAMHESLCKSLFLGGVTHRFPDLRIGFLEGGVGWACALYADLVGHWEKRHAGEIGKLDPGRLDVDAFMAYVEKHGDEQTTARLDDIRAYFSRPASRPDVLDEFDAVGVEQKTDLRDKFAPRFFFGCEADDPLVAWAFREDINPMGAKMQPLFGSDISHWDVPDMTEPVEEAFELVEGGLLDGEQFREFTFLNAVKLHATVNPDFFEGTAVEQAVREALAALRATS